MKRTSFIPLLGLCALLSSCATPGHVDTETAPAADFAQRHTFAWQESQASYDPQPNAGDIEQVKAAIHAAVLAQLGQKGYSEAGDRPPDFLVSFHLVVTATESPGLCVRRHMIFEWPGARPSPDSYDICQFDPGMNNRTVRKGTLVVFVVDAVTRNLLWQGIADDAAGTQKRQIERLQHAVERMFATFPPQTA